MKLGEVRVDRTSVAYLVHAVEGGGPVHRHGGLLPWLGDQPGPKGRPTSAWELVQGRLGGPVPCLRTTRSSLSIDSAHIKHRLRLYPWLYNQPIWLVIEKWVTSSKGRSLSTTSARRTGVRGSDSMLPLTCRGPSNKQTQPGRARTRGENHKSPRDCPCPRVDSLRRT